MSSRSEGLLPLRPGSGSVLWAALREEHDNIEREMESLAQMAAELEGRSAELQAMNRAAAVQDSPAMRSITQEAREIQEILVSELDRLSAAQVRIATQRMQLLQSENDINRRATRNHSVPCVTQPQQMQRSPSFGHFRGGQCTTSQEKVFKLITTVTEATTALNEASLPSSEKPSTGLSTSFAPISPIGPFPGFELVKQSLLSPEKPSSGLSTSFGPISPSKLSLGFEPISPTRSSASSGPISPQHVVRESDLGSENPGLDARLEHLKFGIGAAKAQQHQAAFSKHPEVQVFHGAAGDASEMYSRLDRLCSIRELLSQLRLRIGQAQVQAEALHHGAAGYEDFAGWDDGPRAATFYSAGAPLPAPRRARSLVFPPGRTCRGSFPCCSRMDVRSQLWHCREGSLQMEGYIRDRRHFLQERRLEAPRSWNRLRPGSSVQGCPLCMA